MNTLKLIDKLADIFKNYPEQTELHVTGNGEVFLQKHHAESYASSLLDKERDVRTVERDELEFLRMRAQAFSDQGESDKTGKTGGDSANSFTDGDEDDEDENLTTDTGDKGPQDDSGQNKPETNAPNLFPQDTETPTQEPAKTPVKEETKTTKKGNK